MLKHAAEMTVRGVAGGLVLATLAFAPSPSRAESAWVKDELRLNLRTGPGTEFRILGVMKSGDRVAVVERKEGWTQVQPQKGEAGWIPVGYLQPSAPASIQLTKSEAQVDSLQEQLDEISTEAAQLRTTNQKLEKREVERNAGMEKLNRENQAYRAAAEWGGYITGAGILATGMITGWLLKASSSRNRSSRIRL